MNFIVLMKSQYYLTKTSYSYFKEGTQTLGQPKTTYHSELLSLDVHSGALLSFFVFVLFFSEKGL